MCFGCSVAAEISKWRAGGALCMPCTQSCSRHMPRCVCQGSRFLRKGPKFPTAVLALGHAEPTAPEESSCQKLVFSWAVQLKQLAHCGSEHAGSSRLPPCCCAVVAPAYLRVTSRIRASATASLRRWSGLLAFGGSEALKGTGALGSGRRLLNRPVDCRAIMETGRTFKQGQAKTLWPLLP